jgi:xanthine dehydrogenase molybdenum-binding subunit
MIKINPDGTIILNAPTVEVGPGSNSCAVAACAETLGVKPESIRWISVQDTETGLKDQAQTDSAVSYILAEAVYQCALDAKAKLLAMVAQKMNREPEELDIDDGRVFVIASPETGMTIKEYYDSLELMEEGTLVPLTSYISKPLSTENTGIAYMACFAEVEVDTATGLVEVLKLVVPSDGGTVLNPAGAEGQLAGGQCQGMGESLFEGMIYDEKTGIPLNFNFIDYKFPTMADWPDVDPLCMEVYDGKGLFGACGMGEGAPCCTPRAIENAIYNAIGVRVKEFPITPIKVLEALGKDGE